MSNRSGAALAGALRQHRILAVLGNSLIVGLIVFILIPPTMTLLMSFNESAFIRFPLKALSLRWYGEFFARDEWTRATISSLEIATAVMVVSTVTGVVAAYAYVRHPPRHRRSYYLFLTLPLFVPGAILGLGISILFGSISAFGVALYGAKALVVSAHTMWAMPLAFMISAAACRTIDMSIVDAAADLGSPPVRTFFLVTLPLMRTGVVSSAVLSFVISLNEFPMALFLTNGETRTLPVLMWTSLRSAATPVLAVAAVILLGAVVMGLGLVAWLLSRRAEGS
jgi:ABC-type spermidine/putrescine transport system permease subunit II